MKVTVDRQTWLHGEGSENSYLRRASDNKQCCLGFYSEACGIDAKFSTNYRTLRHIPWSFRTNCLSSALDSYAGQEAFRRAMAFNDVKGLGDSIREWAIQQALAPIDIEIEFIN